jgi:prepilin-type N-terminal cleavage/methylation domain-containing protein
MARRGSPQRRSASGFTLLELMIVLAIAGVLMAIAIPLFRSHQLRSKSAEVKSNLSALRALEESYYSVHDEYIAAPAEPPGIPGSVSADFTPNAAFTELGFDPEGRVYFSYGVAVTPDADGYTADSAADIDGNGFPQLWGFAKPDPGGAVVAGQVGCTVAVLGTEIAPCGSGHGTSVF